MLPSEMTPTNTSEWYNVGEGMRGRGERSEGVRGRGGEEVNSDLHASIGDNSNKY